ncbi:MAG TPA: TlpA disulfide reductase family protein [Vicinamibacterales bacterium]|jgi:thiol-disulfide isomerase/thioredoxin|nr:TlpA disulfide reductase family protein [Vicinamibacterales bacterium]
MDTEQPTAPDAAPGAPEARATESEVPERRPSKVAVFIAMAAVAVAILIVMLAPGAENPAAPAETKGNLTGSPNSAEEDAAADAKVAGKAAPLDFTLKDMNGVDVKLASFKGKPIVVNFWATWCGPCRAEIPSLVELNTQYGAEGKDVVILGISVDDPIEKLKPYATQMKMNYPVLVGNGREDVQDAFGPLWGIPVTVFIDRDGRIAKKHSGIASKEQFEQEIKALL